MDPQIYSLLATVLGALITGIFGLVTTIITLRTKTGEKVLQEKVQADRSIPVGPVSKKPYRRILLFVVVISGAAIGFFIGNATKKSPAVIRLYSKDVQKEISRDKLSLLERQIHETNQEKAEIAEQPALSDVEKEERKKNLDLRLRELEIQATQFQKILRQSE